MDPVAKNYKTELLSSIPVVKAMDIDIEAIGPNGILLSAPLAPNINYEGTAFGGSLNTLNVLAGYLLIHHLVRSSPVSLSSLVIQDSSIRYLRPVRANFKAKACIEPEQKQQLFAGLNRRRLARARITSKIISGEPPVKGCEFEARFVVACH